MNEQDKSALLGRRMTDNRRINSISMGELWQAIVTYRDQPHILLAFLLYLLTPEQSNEAHFKFLIQGLGFRMPGLPTSSAEYDAVVDHMLFKMHRDRLLSGSMPTPGLDLYRQKQDEALREVVTSDPEVFIRRAKMLSGTAEIMLQAAQMMLSGGGHMHLANGQLIEVPALELTGSLATLKSLVGTSNDLFSQVSQELVFFKENQQREEREAQNELDLVDKDILIAIYALEQMGWTPKEVQKRLGVAVVQDKETEEIQMRKIEGRYVISEESEG